MGRFGSIRRISSVNHPIGKLWQVRRCLGLQVVRQQQLQSLEIVRSREWRVQQYKQRLDRLFRGLL